MSIIMELFDKASSGGLVSADEAGCIARLERNEDIFALFAAAGSLREKFRADKIDLCSIISAKTGACPEDCAYCAQSAHSKTNIKTTPLLDMDAVIERALSAKSMGVKRFCIVTSGKKPSRDDLKKIASMITRVRDIGLLPCATLGLLDSDELVMLKDAGLHRYHHNLETSRSHFKKICTTHTYEQKLRTIDSAKSAGLSICSGGIFGIGESWADRIDMAMELRRLDIDSVPVNYLVPIAGTPLGETEPLNPLKALKIISLYRFILPDKEIRVCGGRIQTLGEFNSLIFMAGADGLLTGNCLTVSGRNPEDDLRLIKAYGLGIS